MAQEQDPSLGVNSWLEEELYHQYQFDRQSVDEGWKEVFGHSGPNSNGQPSSLSSLATAVAEPPSSATTPVEPEVPTGPPTPRQEPPSEPSPDREPPAPVTPERDPAPPEPPKGDPPSPEPAPQEVSGGGPATAPGVAEISRSSAVQPSQPNRQPVPTETKTVDSSEQLVPLRGVAARIVENMTASLSIPVATS